MSTPKRRIMLPRLKNRFVYWMTEKERQLDRKVSYAEIARATDVSMGVIMRWVKNDVERFDSPVVVKFCQYFGCQVGDLLYIDDSEDSSAQN
jgi:DNA-binding Xre family transcriptional regulator